MLTSIAMLLSLLAVLVIALVVVGGWVDHLELDQRLGLTTIAAGLIWPGPGEVILRLGLMLLLLSLFGRSIWRRADGLDGAVDGRIGWFPPRF